jgi:L-ascorbate metabolism protein UlaG (beta-lactamase superfamily)
MAARAESTAAAAVTWLGHATTLIEMAAVRVLTDPVVTSRVGPLHNSAAAATRDAALLDVDAVLISHVHPDHLHPASLRRLPPDTRVIVPAGAAPVLERTLRGRVRVEEMAIGERTKVGPVVVEATYAEHKASRPSVGRVVCLGFMVGQGPKVYFAGDTNHFDGMADLGDDIDLALLPVGGWWVTLGPGHFDPLRAAKALRLLRPRAALPIHWGTLRVPGLWRVRPGLQTRAGATFAGHAARMAPEVTVHLPAPGTAVTVPS